MATEDRRFLIASKAVSDWCAENRVAGAWLRSELDKKGYIVHQLSSGTKQAPPVNLFRGTNIPARLFATSNWTTAECRAWTTGRTFAWWSRSHRSRKYSHSNSHSHPESPQLRAFHSALRKKNPGGSAGEMVLSGRREVGEVDGMEPIAHIVADVSGRCKSPALLEQRARAVDTNPSLVALVGHLAAGLHRALWRCSRWEAPSAGGAR